MRRFDGAGKRVCVVGAGLAGACFGLSLLHHCQKQGVPAPDIRLFERDASPQARAGQGYSVSVRDDQGALQASSLARS